MLIPFTIRNQLPRTLAFQRNYPAGFQLLTVFPIIAEVVARQELQAWSAWLRLA